MPILPLASLEQFQAVQFKSDLGAIGGPNYMPNVIEVHLRWSLGDGKIARNILHGRKVGTVTLGVPLANAIMTQLAPNAEFTAMALHLAPTVQFAGVSVRDISITNPGPPIVIIPQPLFDSTNAALPGTSTGTELPDETSICVTMRTALAGRQNRGRMFLPGWATTALGAGNVINAAVITAVNNWSSNRIFTAFSTNGLQLVVGQKARAAYTGSTGTAHPARPAGSVDATAFATRDNHWDTQRRRGLR